MPTASLELSHQRPKAKCLPGVQVQGPRMNPGLCKGKRLLTASPIRILFFPSLFPCPSHHPHIPLAPSMKYPSALKKEILESSLSDHNLGFDLRTSGNMTNSWDSSQKQCGGKMQASQANFSTRPLTTYLKISSGYLHC